MRRPGVGTWLEHEEAAYPRGGFTRRGVAKLQANPHNPVALPYGELRKIRASIPDTFFTVPARLRFKGRVVRGFLSYTPAGEDRDAQVLTFTPEAEPARCERCAPGEGCRKAERPAEVAP